MIEVKVLNEKEVAKRLFSMREKVPKVIRLAVNDTATEARQRLAEKAQETYTVKIGGFKKAMRIKRATNSNLTAIISANGKRLSSGKFSTQKGKLGPEKYYNPVIHRLQTGKGGESAAVRLLKKGKFKTVKGGRGFPIWFKTKFGSGHAGVFQREGKDRTPIKEKMGLSIPQMIGSEKHVYGILEPHIQSDLEKALDRHIARAVRGDF